MGEIQNQPFQLSFNTALKIDFQGSRSPPTAAWFWCRNSTSDSASENSSNNT